MGIDAVVLVKLHKDADYSEYSLEQLEDTSYLAIGATHRLMHIEGRYWSVDYNRGSWPYLLRELLDVMSDERVSDVWYGGNSDCSDAFEKVTPKWIMKMTKEWMNQNLPRSR